MSNHFYLSMSVGFYVLYIFGVLMYALIYRKKAIIEGKLDLRYFKSYSGHGGQPEHLKIIENHINNQFQLPLIFMLTAVLILSFNSVNFLSVVFSWFFVVSRVVHSYIHLGGNNPINRAMIYMLGWASVFLLWIQIIIHFANI